MILSVDNLSFGYKKNVQIFKDVNFSIQSGDILCILGANGVGKSTLLNCLVNLYKPISGKVMIDNQDIKTMNYHEISQYIGYVPQIHNPQYGYTVKEYVAMGIAPKIGVFAKPSREDYKFVDEILARMEIDHLSNKSYTEISGGERQKASIAKVLAQEPKIIILDEPTAYLDYGNQHKTINLVKTLAKEGYAIIITTHQPEHAMMLEQYVGIIMRDGNFIFGSNNDIISQELLTELYNIKIKMTFVESLDKKVICVVD